MNFVQKGLQNIVDNNGASLSFAGMGIVFLSLAVIAMVIWLLPRFMVLLDKIIPEKVIEPKVRARKDSDDGAAIAAIAAAIYKQKRKAV